MPKMTERERLAKIEADQRNLAREAETVRRGLRAQYGKVATEIAVERLSEREFRDVLGQAIRVGGGAALAALKALPAASDDPPARGCRSRLVPPRGGSPALRPDRRPEERARRRCSLSGKGSDVGGRNARQRSDAGKPFGFPRSCASTTRDRLRCPRRSPLGWLSDQAAMTRRLRLIGTSGS
jgi:hypothetical protein